MERRRAEKRLPALPPGASLAASPPDRSSPRKPLHDRHVGFHIDRPQEIELQQSPGLSVRRLHELEERIASFHKVLVEREQELAMVRQQNIELAQQIMQQDRAVARVVKSVCTAFESYRDRVCHSVGTSPRVPIFKDKVNCGFSDSEEEEIEKYVSS
ncbi:hypothetical protein AAL_08009 [Moelleriella libera RCEF 2490]|uniref:Uncharacterized protein n=1 Tax=Moelleriella libera RCEF 2490 TaxID=1081109 RepID=A0A167WG64_9HYPO|nr:hypothetical protein AAL_08009 [Moelleriella libera RCEF 2490]